MENCFRIDKSKRSLLGVSIGDAFGESFFGSNDAILSAIQARIIPPSKWEFTDDTVMSMAVFEELEATGEIDQDRLVKKFCRNHELDLHRGYGATLRSLLREIAAGQNWQTAAAAVFDGQGSMGNGAAMRVAPIGAFYFDDLPKVKELAVRSAETTHCNIEAVAGAIAVATGAALTTKMAFDNAYLTPTVFIDSIINELPDTDTRAKISKSKKVPYSYNIETVKSILGNGTNMTSQDTVPFAIWCTAHNLGNFEEALWKAVSILGDRDTICAMVAGMTIMSSKEENIPAHWLTAVESFENSIFRIRE